MAHDDLPRLEIDYAKSAVACETSDEKYNLLPQFYYNEEDNALSSQGDADAKMLCVKSYQTTEEYTAAHQETPLQKETGGLFSNLGGESDDEAVF